MMHSMEDSIPEMPVSQNEENKETYFTFTTHDDSPQKNLAIVPISFTSSHGKQAAREQIKATVVWYKFTKCIGGDKC